MIWRTIGIVTAIVAAAAGVSPDAAIENWVRWIGFVGFEGYAGVTRITVVVALAALAGLFLMWPYLQRRHRLNLVRRLDDLFAEGVAKRNRLIPVVANFSNERELESLVEWKNRVLAQLRRQPRLYSQIRTLNLFDSLAHKADGKSAQQEKLEAIWTETLARLRTTIDELAS